MSFRTISMLAVLALIVIVAMNMNREELENMPGTEYQLSDNGSSEATIEPDATDSDEEVLAEELEAVDAPVVEETTPPAEISDEPIDAPEADETPVTEEILDGESMEEEPMEEPATGGEDRVETPTNDQS